MRRFYKTVALAAGPGGDGVLLDGKPVRTPARNLLILPSAALAAAAKEEWESQGDTIDPHSMPITGLANAAIDRVTPDRDAFARDLAAYGETDLLCYRAADPPDLVARQQGTWDPLLQWARLRYDIAFEIIVGIIHRPQPPATIARLTEAIGARTSFELAALSPLITISGSLVTSLALAEGEIDPDAAFDATHLDELWQAEHWGEDWMATDARAARRADFNAAARFLSLL